MAEFFSSLTEKHIQFIDQQQLFFVATAAADGQVNLSPKGMQSLKVVDANNIVWLNLTGSGNETAAHLRQKNRMTIMFCSYAKQPLILRIYGSAQAVHPRDPQWQSYSRLIPGHSGARQFFEFQIDSVQTSCGYAVPYYDFVGERETLTNWADKKGPEGVKSYWQENNQQSIDGFDSGIL
ncbi:MAG: pyridoxamine 5'-phosphate oxidase family protein [Pseudomonadales bacterium]|nr:pyridoxamine 5'-phosphate oxidase family protein [Pseudomonadales bacterium]